jgi:sulfur-oxidizing protein SoxZ
MSFRPRVRVPPQIRAGEVVEIKTLVSHIMETGQRRDADGQIIPRNIIHTFTAVFDGKEVFKADLNSGISANPYLAFTLKVSASGELQLTWIDDSKQKVVETVPITVAS